MLVRGEPFRSRRGSIANPQKLIGNTHRQECLCHCVRSLDLDRSLRFAREAQKDVDFDAVGKLDIFEEIEDAAAKSSANFADVAVRRL